MKNKALKFSVPEGNVTVQVRIIDTGSRIGKIPLTFLMRPGLPGVDYMEDIPSWSFLIEHPSGYKTVFDLGLPKERRELAPVIANDERFSAWDIRTPKEVIDVLQENNIAPENIDSLIWSHWHWDHIGDPSRYPSTTELIVGPGFSKNLLPGYPRDPRSPLRESDFSGRALTEIDFADPKRGTKVGQFRAYDFFGDGSFFLLDAPGHAVGHIAAMARTTSDPDTFILMGGDLCHHGGQIRPSQSLEIPRELSGFSLGKQLSHEGIDFEELLLHRGVTITSPFFVPDAAQCVDEQTHAQTRKKAQEADSQENIWLIFAHDPSLLNVVDFFPASANSWKANNWRTQTLWSFLHHLEGGLA